MADGPLPPLSTQVVLQPTVGAPKSKTRRKRKRVDAGSDNTKNRKGTLCKHHLKPLRNNVRTVILQMKDIEMKVEAIHSAITKVNIHETLEQLVQSSLDTGKEKDPSPKHKKKHKSVQTDDHCSTQSPQQTVPSAPGPLYNQEASYIIESTQKELDSKSALVVSLGTQIDILEGEIDDKSCALRKTQSECGAQLKAKENEINLMRAALNTNKFTVDKANNELRKYIAKESEWDIIMSKKSN